MKSKSIAVIGQGFVGGSLTTVFSERGYKPYVYDISGKVAIGGHLPNFIDERLNDVRRPSSVVEFVSSCEHPRSDTSFSKVYFVCLPTPMFEDGTADLSIVESVLRDLASVKGERIAVVKSTIPPGTTEKWNSEFSETGLRVVFNPEFLTEANALDDMRNQTRIILGGPRPYINVVKQVFQSAFPKVPIVKTSSTNAELVKYVTNCFLAMKLSFANEMYQLCDALDKKGLNVDYDRVIECATMDSRLGTSHWRVPSFEVDDNGKSLFGWALSCFPKDLNALIAKELELNLKPTMLKAAWEKNLEVRPQKDWNKLLGRAVSSKKVS
jgi:nucleotide sugar dehydrogenase